MATQGQQGVGSPRRSLLSRGGLIPAAACAAPEFGGQRGFSARAAGGPKLVWAQAAGQTPSVPSDRA